MMVDACPRLTHLETPALDVVTMSEISRREGASNISVRPNILKGFASLVS
jgi:hypothetical protein